MTNYYTSVKSSLSEPEKTLVNHNPSDDSIGARGVLIGEDNRQRGRGKPIVARYEPYYEAGANALPSVTSTDFQETNSCHSEPRET
jgi:hypothetical protein